MVDVFKGGIKTFVQRQKLLQQKEILLWMIMIMNEE